MREEMEELQALYQVIQTFPKTAHWFCPKRNSEDDADYSNPNEAEEDLTIQAKHKLIADAKERHNTAYRFALILGLDLDVSGDLLTFYTKNLAEYLTSCDKCVQNWHMGRKAYLKQLAEIYDEEIVNELSRRLNELDFARIEKGLAAAEVIIRAVDPEKRSQALLVKADPVALMALYEALCCPDYHNSEALLSKSFNYVFRQIQVKKPLRIKVILPSMTRFLFDSDPVRVSFAQSGWDRTDGVLDTETFNWVVHDNLEKAMSIISQPGAPVADVERFWSGFLKILAKMDENLITHSLRAMEVQPDIYHLTLQHVAYHSAPVLRLVIDALRGLLRRSSKDFWAAFNKYTPSTVADQILQNPSFVNLLMAIEDFSDPETGSAIVWVSEFIESLESVLKYELCRVVVHHFMESMQDKIVPESARMACCYAGLDALRVTLAAFATSQYAVDTSTSLVVINNIIGLVNVHQETIVGFADLKVGNKNNMILKQTSLAVLRDALSLDCKGLNAEFDTMRGGALIQRGIRSNSQLMWESVLKIFRPDDLELAKCILAATTALVGVDELYPEDKRKPNLPQDHAGYNNELHILSDNVAKVFVRLSDCTEGHLRQLCLSTETTHPLFGALVSFDQDIREAAVEVIKNMTGCSDKKEAISSLLGFCLAPYLKSMTFAAQRILRTKAFAPTPSWMKIGRETLDALCGTTGVLRQTSLPKDDRNTLFLWWSVQWRALETIFSNMEGWVYRVDRPMEYMQDFCRDGMDYAEALFDQYSVVASALEDPITTNGDGKDQEIAIPGRSAAQTRALKRVLSVVCRHVYGLAILLRLKDAYLVSVITTLLCKLLRCLGEFNMEVDERASNFIINACKRQFEPDFKPTKLTAQQKAELQRTLDEHLRIEQSETPVLPEVKRQATIETWSRSIDTPSRVPKLKDGKRRESSIMSKFLTTDSSKHQNILDKMKPKPVPNRLTAEAMKSSRRAAQEEKKKRDAEAIARARALRDPRGSAVGTAGEGSSLQGISGVLGKDHAPVRSEIMVGSSDEESSEDDDIDEADSLEGRTKAVNEKILEYEASRKRAREQALQGPVRKTKIVRSPKDLRARVEPNMDNLYIQILNWDIHADSEVPPGSNGQYLGIAKKFLDLDLYKKTFSPLLISEVWLSLVIAKDENIFKPIEVKVLNRLSVDKFMEVSATMPFSLIRDRSVSERDVVLLSKSPNPMRDKDEPYCLARVDRTKPRLGVRDVTFRVSRDTNPLVLQSLVPNGKVFALKIADMTTTQREYAALSSLEYYDLCSEILEAKPSPIRRYPSERVTPLAERYCLNVAQTQAILSANDNDGFTLIQGPPGSGKTKTIVAMIGALLTPVLRQSSGHVMARPQPSHGPGIPARMAPKKKLLVCAPSNAAVDELVVRLMEGVLPLTGAAQKIKVLRIGRSDAINAAVKEVTLDEMIRIKLEGDQAKKIGQASEREKMHQEAGKIKERLLVLRPLMDAARGTASKEDEQKYVQEFDTLKRAQSRVNARIDQDKEAGTTATRDSEIHRRRLQQEIIDESHVICATLSGSGHDMFRSLDIEFETVIIDEAAQCIELAALIPLKYGCSKCIMVGDPEQLPPTVLSKSAVSYGYEQSLFVRMQHNWPSDVHLLDTQYRMHPDISLFPSQQFYNSRLTDGGNMAELRLKPWHASNILGPYRFFDVKGTQKRETKGHSFINEPELYAAIALYTRLKADYPEVDFKGMIGVIATYKAQLNELKSRFAHNFGDGIFDEIEFNTTDAFQGREREIIIFSCVRAQQSGGIGFLKDIRRMNVGLTRAKSSLWVLGDSRALGQGEYWNKLITDAKDRGKYTGGDVLSLLAKPTARNDNFNPGTKRRMLFSSPESQLKKLPNSAVDRPAAIDFPLRLGAPKQDTPKQDAPKQDAPKQDAPKQDAPKQAAPKQAAPMAPKATPSSESTKDPLAISKQVPTGPKNMATKVTERAKAGNDTSPSADKSDKMAVDRPERNQQPLRRDPTDSNDSQQKSNVKNLNEVRAELMSGRSSAPAKEAGAQEVTLRPDLPPSAAPRDSADDKESGRDRTLPRGPTRGGQAPRGGFSQRGNGTLWDRPFRGDSYRGDSYRGDSYRGDSYRDDSYRDDSYRGDSYRGDSYRGDSSHRGHPSRDSFGGTRSESGDYTNRGGRGEDRGGRGGDRGGHESDRGGDRGGRGFDRGGDRGGRGSDRGGRGRSRPRQDPCFVPPKNRRRPR